jgi:hypothetical protein
MLRQCAAFALMTFIGLTGSVHAAIFSVSPGDFLPGKTVIGFETGSTGLPSVPNVTFLSEGFGSPSTWFDSSANFEGFLGSDQGWSNLTSLDYSNLGIRFTTPVEAVGAYVGRIPNFRNAHPPSVTVRLYDASLTLLGSQSISIPAAFNSPVWFGFRASAPISRLEIRVNNAGFIGADFVTFGNVTGSPEIPEPATLLLFGLGALGVGGASRFRRHAV